VEALAPPPDREADIEIDSVSVEVEEKENGEEKLREGVVEKEEEEKEKEDGEEKLREGIGLEDEEREREDFSAAESIPTRLSSSLPPSLSSSPSSPSSLPLSQSELLSLRLRFRSDGVEVCTRAYLLKQYAAVFVASQAVTWVASQVECDN
jgi:hypothetical protein